MECCSKAVTGALASQMGGQLLCLGGINNVAAGHLLDSKMPVSPPLLSKGMSRASAHSWTSAASAADPTSAAGGGDHLLSRAVGLDVGWFSGSSRYSRPNNGHCAVCNSPLTVTGMVHPMYPSLHSTPDWGWGGEAPSLAPKVHGPKGAEEKFSSGHNVIVERSGVYSNTQSPRVALGRASTCAKGGSHGLCIPTSPAQLGPSLRLSGLTAAQTADRPQTPPRRWWERDTAVPVCSLGIPGGWGGSLLWNNTFL